jgi:trigger factor
MRSTAEHLDGNMVRLSVEMDEAEVEGIVADSYKTLSRQARVPGFRPGKVPRQVLEARLGGAVALRAEALRDALPDLYGKAVAEANLDPIAPPEIDITSGKEGGPLAFDALVQVRPLVGIPGYAGLRVEVPAVEATDEEIDRQVDRMRDTEAELVEVSRPAAEGDHVTVDVHGTRAGEEIVATDDYLYEVGSMAIGPEVDAVLHGAKPGDVLTAEAAPPGADDPAAETVSFRLLVKEVKEKQLPELNDEWAAESSDFDTVDELRADMRRRISSVKRLQAQAVLREGSLRALAELVDADEVPGVLVEDEMRQRLHRLEHRLAEQKVTIDQLLLSTGQSAEQFTEELRSGALDEVKGDLALYALAEAEGIEATDAEVDADVADMAERLDVDEQVLRTRLEHEDRMPAVRSERRKRKAFDWLVEHVEMVDSEGNNVPRAALELDEQAPGDEPRDDEEDTDVEPTQGGSEA